MACASGRACVPRVLRASEHYFVLYGAGGRSAPDSTQPSPLLPLRRPRSLPCCSRGLFQPSGHVAPETVVSAGGVWAWGSASAACWVPSPSAASPCAGGSAAPGQSDVPGSGGRGAEAGSASASLGGFPCRDCSRSVQPPGVCGGEIRAPGAVGQSCDTPAFRVSVGPHPPEPGRPRPPSRGAVMPQELPTRGAGC